MVLAFRTILSVSQNRASAGDTLPHRHLFLLIGNTATITEFLFTDFSQTVIILTHRTYGNI